MMPSVDTGHLLSLLIYGVPLFLAWAWYGRSRTVRARRNRAWLEESVASGLQEPPSLHPVINPNRCLGCAACVGACPEQGVLGIIDDKAVLIRAANCIGHGACKGACPFDAITLVLGTERRGVDIPTLGSDFQTNVPGIFVAGELGGMGLIRNAIEQGRQAMESIRAREGVRQAGRLDVLIVGGGPAGFSASLAALEAGLDYVTVEQETLGGTVAHYPRGKIVMTAPVDLPLYGRVRLRETSKEALLELWKSVEKDTGVQISYGERVEEITGDCDGFRVRTTCAEYRTRNVLLAIGRRGTPRRLGVPGEDSSKVVYRLIDPEQYRGQEVLVVGGGDSALEAAVSLVDEPGTSVTLAYRGPSFSRAKPANREKVEAAEASAALRVMFDSTVSEILPESVRLQVGDAPAEIANDAVVVNAGGVLPTAFLESIGIEVTTKHGTV